MERKIIVQALKRSFSTQSAHTTSIEDTLYEDEVDYTTQAF